MMQTLLTNTPPVQAAAPADKSAQLQPPSDNGEPTPQGEPKGGFSDAMAKAQANGAPVTKAAQAATSEPKAGSQVVTGQVADDKGASDKHADAKSLANATEGSAATDDKKKKTEEAESSASPIDFLQRLQDALKQDTSLVSPAPLNLITTASAVETDGNMLPQAGEGAEAADVLVGAGDKPLTLDDRKAATGAALQAQQAASLLKGEGVEVPAAEGEAQAMESDAAAMAAQLKDAGKDPKEAGKDKGAAGTDKAGLTGAERAALLSKVLPTEAVDKAAKGEGNKSVEIDASAKPVTPSMSNKEGVEKAHPQRAMEQAVPTQTSATRAFEAGQERVDTDTTRSTDGAQARGAAEGGEQAQARAATAAKSESPLATASSSATAPATQQPAEPVLTAPQQVLASSESQGPQASLSALSAGIKQMEASEGRESAKVRSEVKVDVKQKVAEFGKGSALGTESSTHDSNHSQQVQQNSQPQVANNDSKPTVDIAARRDPQNLPHLKLANPEAPAQLHQKVNLMLADKLQQAEIQLDPLGLGKMKIQIQIGADNQANVHFVVQHGQTREMLEQAMPRLRDMLAGQGIQLGQTIVQQQPQQQSQGQSAFAGQGQQGQKESGTFAETGQTEAEVSAAGSRLLTESTNDSGIDFYA
ncbi:flagellar hook-length control protein FliK [Aeromonas piscicola]|uniref:Flagellar hook-length control protein FliK n=1 Tax=Aeromonas piscicola TaxID=600645 RepID=A0ABT7Q889_9GAMM|nr:flagellar hook-length control protein FliK [Aeromonas piscicola]MDM5130150.1 flagellar hook-length control protein FliK [Aeromonas piscicola]